jgi:polysaccharide export outer membrane protein
VQFGWGRKSAARRARRSVGRLLALAAGLLVVVPVLALTAGGAFAQVPTSDQIQLLQSLGPAQREAALQALRQGGDLSVSPRTGMNPFGLPGEGPGASGTPVEGMTATQGGEAAQAATQVPLPSVVRPGDALVIGLRDPLPRTEPIPSGAVLPDRPWDERTFHVDRDGRLWLPSEDPLQVMGWTEDEVAQAISSLAYARKKEVMARILPRSDLVTGLGVRPFGYDIFTGPQGPPFPDPNAPVSKDYQVGPGDTFLIQIFGKESAEYELGVTRDGTLLVPKFGPMQVAGLPFDEARRMITERIEGRSIGVKVAVTMGQLRTLQVFVLGDVVRPGAQVVSAFATPLHALMAAGGVLPNGSLRHVVVKHGGKLLATVDLYDVLLKGDTAGYGRLQSGDVVFVPPVSAKVVVAGLVRRPAVYEMMGGETVADVLALAGGITAAGDRAAIRLRRLDTRDDGQSVQEVRDLGPDQLATPVRDGDVVQVFPRLAPDTGAVTVRGHVAGPGQYAWVPGMRLTDLFPAPAGQLLDTDLSYVLVIRPTQERKFYLQTNLADAEANPSGPANLALMPDDQVLVFGLDEDRAQALVPEVAEIRREAVAGVSPDRTVRVEGEVHFNGEFPLSEGMHLTDLIAAAGDVTARAYPYEVEITRFTIAPHGERRETEHIRVDLAAARKGEPGADPLMAPDDVVHVRATPEWQGEVVNVSGEVRFPGNYVIEQGETVTSLIARAGGLTDEAFLPGAFFQREDVRRQEQAELDRLSRTFEQDLVRVATQPVSFGTGDRSQALVAGKELLQMTREAKATGRVAIHLEQENDGSVVVKDAPLRLMGSDRIIIPRRPDSVLVVGEVYHPTAHLYRKGERVDDYIGRSGGMTKFGDHKSVLVVHADGSVTAVKVGWLHSGGRVALGDTIVVPQRVSLFSGLKLATDVTQILYQLAITAAAAHAIGVL